MIAVFFKSKFNCIYSNIIEIKLQVNLGINILKLIYILIIFSFRY